MKDKVGKINQAIHDVIRRLYFIYCLRSRLNSSWAPGTSLRGLAILALFLTKTCPLSKMEFWYALNCVEPWLKKENGLRPLVL